MSGVGRFAVVGVLAVLTDFCVYQLLLWAGLGTAAAKASSFVAGAVLAYVLNRSWTFQAKGGAAVVSRFFLLYGATLACNVAVNAAILAILPISGRMSGAATMTAFVVATGFSATLNYLGMRWCVFAATRQEART